MTDRHAGLTTGCAIAIVVTLTAGVGLAFARAGDEDFAVFGGTSGTPARRSVSADEVSDRPWQVRVAATGPWSASLTGSGDRITFTTDGVVVGGLRRVTVDLGSRDPGEPPSSTKTALALPDGSRWYAREPFDLEAEGDLPFTAVGRSPDDTPFGDGAFTTLEAEGAELTVRAPSWDALLTSARGPVTAVGRFVERDGREAERLPLPVGSRVSVDCPPPDPNRLPCEESPGGPLRVGVTAAEDMTVRAGGDGEAAIAGRIHAEALGQAWDGSVGAVEGGRLNALAVYQGGEWALTADAAAARQVWIDVWPVVDTLLSARSVGVRPGVFDSKDLKIEWTNVGYATGQIIAAEGVGDGAPMVEFDLNKTLGHDAGLDVRRGDWIINLEGGGDIDSHLAPGEGVSRRLSAQEGTQATIVLRGNFPEVQVPLAIPPG